MIIARHTNGKHELILVEVGKPPTRNWRRIAQISAPRSFTKEQWLTIAEEGKRLAACWNACEGISDPAAFIQAAKVLMNSVGNEEMPAALEAADVMRSFMGAQ
jgi:hypothetical protein